MPILAMSALLGTYFGFAGSFGDLIFQARANSERRDLTAAILFVAVIFVLASLALPLSIWLKLPIWATGLAITAIFGLRPDRLPSWLWSPTFAYRYLVGVMAVITFWSLSQSTTPPILGLGILAAIAGGSAISKWKSYELTRTQQAAPNPNAK